MSDYPIEIQESDRKPPFHCEMGGCRKQCFECSLIQTNEEQKNCKHPRHERVYIGNNMLRCNVCEKEFK